MSNSHHVCAGLHRFTAMVCLVLVLVLDVLAVSPTAHAWFHAIKDIGGACADHDHSHSEAPFGGDSEHTCVVYNFAAGHALLERPPEIANHARFVIARPPLVFDQIAPRPSRFLRPPGCGPPEVGIIGT